MDKIFTELLELLGAEELLEAISLGLRKIEDDQATILLALQWAKEDFLEVAPNLKKSTNSRWDKAIEGQVLINDYLKANK